MQDNSPNSMGSQEYEYVESPSKRRRISSDQDFSDDSTVPLPSMVIPKRNITRGYGMPPVRFNKIKGEDTANEEESITISATSKQATQTVAPFLAKHIPEQYAPMGGLDQSGVSKSKDTNTKYCYRHRPDLKCRRQVNEPSMDQLQHELEALSQSDQQAITHVWSLFSAAPSKHRHLMLQGILMQCCFPQLSFIASNVRDLIKLDFLSALPPEISFKILCFLDTTSLCKAAQVSQRWRSLADDDVVWHKMCEQHIDRKCLKCGWGLPLLERKRLRASKRQIQLRATGKGLNEWSPNITPFPEATPGTHDRRFSVDASTPPKAQHPHLPATALTKALEPHSKRQLLTPSGTDMEDSHLKPRFRPWKDVYKDRFKVGTNWKYGRCSTKVFKGHTNGVMCLQFDDHILASGSYDTTIKIWDINTGEELRTLRGHANGIRCLQFDNTKLISGSLDHTIKVWNWRTGECISTYNGHSDGVITLHFDSTILASGSRDKTVKIWNFEDKSTFVLRGHTDWVNSVKVDSASRTVFSASDDCTVRLWDLDTKTCIKTFEGHVGQVQQVVPLPPEFECEDFDADPHDDGASSTASTHSHQQLAASPNANANSAAVHDHEAFGPTFSSQPIRPLPPRYMLTGALDSTIRLWSVSTQKCLRTYFGHVEGIWALAADVLRVVSGAQDCMVKVWDGRSGRCERTFTGHAGAVTCIGLSDERMGTGGEDGEVRVYRF